MTHSDERPSAARGARILSSSAMTYGDDWHDEDLPAYVRGASTLRRWHGVVVVAQDDVSALAVVDVMRPDAVVPVLLPRGEAGRRTFGPSLGNKTFKMDLEASVVLPDGRYVAFGSGSTERRETIVVMHPDRRVVLVDGHAWYAQLRGEPAFAGDELNVEGALVVEDALWLFQRRNSVGSQSAIGVIALDAFVRWIDGRGQTPSIQSVHAVDLGAVEGVPYGFTDATVVPNGDVYAIASAEATANAYDDGPVLGTILLRLARDARPLMTFERWDIADVDGTPTTSKIEGLEYASGSGDAREPLEFWAVTDDDDESAASLLLRIRVQR